MSGTETGNFKKQQYLRNAYCLLLHGFMYCCSVMLSHAIEKNVRLGVIDLHDKLGYIIIFALILARTQKQYMTYHVL